MVAQLFEMLRLRLSPSKIMPDEYFDLRLFNPALNWEAKREFLGRRTRNRVCRIQDPIDSAIATEKLLAYRLFLDAGLPFPTLLAVAHPVLIFPGAAQLHDAAAIVRWLQTDATFPFFAKPSRGQRGVGGRLVMARDGDKLHLGDGSSIVIDAFAKQYQRPALGAGLFQERIIPHPSLAAVIGDRTATARIVVLNDGPEPEITRAALRIPSGCNMTDSFADGKKGNLLALVDRFTGAVVEVLAGIGLDRRTTDVHPDTGRRFAGLMLPDWDAAVAMVRAGARLLPGLRFQGWDVAFSDRGPLLVEVNARSDYSQQANNRGIADARFRRMYPGGRI